MLSQETQITKDNINTEIQLVFKDVQSFVAGGSLKDFVKNFGNGKEDLNKGLFPYEAINSENYIDILDKSEPFEHQDFYSSLARKNITEQEYNVYLEDTKKFKSRWNYLQYYNEQDVRIMIEPIDNLINLFAAEKIDMLDNLSLSSCATAMKYAYCYKDFDLNKNYPVINKKSTFELTFNNWKNKCENYYKQDIKANRDTRKNVSVDDYKYFKNLFENGRCHYCSEYFDKVVIIPTLDRIDDSKSHSKDNVIPLVILVILVDQINIQLKNMN